MALGESESIRGGSRRVFARFPALLARTESIQDGRLFTYRSSHLGLQGAPWKGANGRLFTVASLRANEWLPLTGRFSSPSRVRKTDDNDRTHRRCEPGG